MAISHGASGRRFGSPFALFARLASLLALTVALAGLTLPHSALAESDSGYIMQCGCPVTWEGEWDGAGVFDEDTWVDTIALTDGAGVLLVHEYRLEDASVANAISDRSRALTRADGVADLEEPWSDDTDTTAEAGRIWTNADGDTVYGFQFVQVWESDFVLSIEFVATEDDFVDAWDSLGDVFLIDSPMLSGFDPEEVVANITS